MVIPILAHRAHQPPQGTTAIGGIVYPSSELSIFINDYWLCLWY